MGLNKLTPSMAVALVALVLSMTGGALAAVNFARNAGAVDGFSAVGSTASLVRAAGKLVATDESGRLPAKFLAGVTRTDLGTSLTALPDNGASTPERVLGLKVGSISASCFDQQPNAGFENPATRFFVNNFSDETLNVSYKVGGGDGAIESVAAGGAVSFVVGSGGIFDVQLQGAETSVIVQGGARESGRGTPDGACGVFATALFAEDTG